jgi:hypothetical protein
MPCPLVNGRATPGCANGPVDGSTVDGFLVSNSLAAGLVAGGLGVQCPGNICSGINGAGQSVQFWAFAGGGSGYFNIFPGQANSLFYSPNAAGAAAALATMQASMGDSTFREYGAPVYSVGDVYSFGFLQAGPPCDPEAGPCTVDIDTSAIPDWATTIGLAHDHPGTYADWYDFSNVDIDTLAPPTGPALYGFLATEPVGRVLMFDPNLYANWMQPGAQAPVCALQGPLMGVQSCQ